MIRIRASGIWEWTVTHKRGGVVLDRGEFPNGVTIVGRNLLGDALFAAGAVPAAWYAGLISDTSFDSVSESDTMTSHAGWTENTSYSESTRVQWSPAASASGILYNSEAMVFTASAQTRVRGAFLVDDSTKSATTGTLYCTGLFASPKLLESGQVLNLRYRHTLTG